MKEKLFNLIDSYNFDNQNEFINFYNECENVFKNIRQNKNCILISQFDGIGDAILISGCIKFLKEYYKLPLVIACYDFVSPIFLSNPYIDKVIILEKNDNIEQTQYLKKIITLINNELWGKDLYPQEAFHLQYAESNQTAYFFNYFSGCENRIGFWENDWKNYYTDITNEFSIDKYLINKHIILPQNIIHMVDRHYFILEKYLSVSINDKNIFVYINDNDNNSIQQYLKINNIIINLGGSNKNKKYPPKQINEFLHKIDNKYNVILIGGKNDIGDTVLCHN